MCGATEDNVPFHKSSRRCKPCAKIYKKQYRENNKEKIAQQDINYRQENKDYLLDKQRKYRAANPEMILTKARDYRDRTREDRRKTKREYEREKLKDIKYRLKTVIASAVYVLLKGIKNNLPVLKFLPYTMEELKQHLESQFESWMTWDNYGKYFPKTWDDNDTATWTWQIDHIVPQSDLPYASMVDENFKKCWALENLRPLSSKQNLLDGTQRTRHAKQNGNT
jgi:hypothetical protein